VGRRISRVPSVRSGIGWEGGLFGGSFLGSLCRLFGGVLLFDICGEAIGRDARAARAWASGLRGLGFGAWRWVFLAVRGASFLMREVTQNEVRGILNSRTLVPLA
jgi:hypothetical protein